MAVVTHLRQPARQRQGGRVGQRDLCAIAQPLQLCAGRQFILDRLLQQIANVSLVALRLLAQQLSLGLHLQHGLQLALGCGLSGWCSAQAVQGGCHRKPPDNGQQHHAACQQNQVLLTLGQCIPALLQRGESCFQIVLRAHGRAFAESTKSALSRVSR